MPKDTITLALNGDISLGDFSKAVQGFLNLVTGLRSDIAKDASIEWFIEDLEAGSAIATVGDNAIIDGLRHKNPKPIEGSSTVFANGRSVHRVGEKRNCGAVTVGSSDVYVGD